MRAIFDPGEGWAQYQKTSDLTLWWAKRAPIALIATYDAGGGEAEVTAAAGDWFLTTDPLPAGDGAVLTNLITDTDANLKSLYTPQ
jgi:hypothetical protein